MWPFSGSKGLSGKSRSPEGKSTPDFRSTQGSVSTVRLEPGKAGASTIWSDRLTDLYLYWQEKCGTRFWPARADIDPLDIPALLPIVYLVETEGAVRDFRFRLVGSEFARKYGADVTGKTLGEVNRHQHAEAVLQDYAICSGEGAPLVSRNSFINDQGVYWRYERILMPLGSDAGRVGMILGGMDINIPLSEVSKLDTL